MPLQKHIPKTSRPDKIGYFKIDLYKDKKHVRRFVHRLVIESFKPKLPFVELEVNHVDGNKFNNSLYNLEWTTRLENVRHYHSLNKKRKLQQRGVNL